MKALTTQKIFLILISISAAGNIQSMTNSSDAFGNRTCALPQPTAPPCAWKENVSYVNLGKFRKNFLFMINAACLKLITVDNECVNICN
jgi:hypothetical protein